MTENWWVSNGRATGWVQTVDGVIVDGCPYFKSYMLGKRKAIYDKYTWVSLGEEHVEGNR